MVEIRTLAIQIGVAGSVLGLLSGIIEASFGSQILPWIGNKENPLVLGLVTFVLSCLALITVVFARTSNKITNNRRLANILGLLLPATICFTTVGRLWYLPGFLLLTTVMLFGYEYWFDKSNKIGSKVISDKYRVNQIIGGIGSFLVLASIGMAFIKNQFALFRAETFIGADLIHVEVLPMDIIRRSILSSSSMTTNNIEVGLVMAVYILLVLGSAISLIASLAKSRLFTRIGGVVVFIGLIFSFVCLHRILAQVGYPIGGFQNIINSLGLGWYIILFGSMLIIISSFLRFQPRNVAKV